jgi:hypothetical protein
VAQQKLGHRIVVCQPAPAWNSSSPVGLGRYQMSEDGSPVGGSQQDQDDQERLEGYESEGDREQVGMRQTAIENCSIPLDPPTRCTVWLVLCSAADRLLQFSHPDFWKAVSAASKLWTCHSYPRSPIAELHPRHMLV